MQPREILLPYRHRCNLCGAAGFAIWCNPDIRSPIFLHRHQNNGICVQTDTYVIIQIIRNFSSPLAYERCHICWVRMSATCSAAVITNPLPSASHANRWIRLHLFEVRGRSVPPSTGISITFMNRPTESVLIAMEAIRSPSGDHATL